MTDDEQSTPGSEAESEAESESEPKAEAEAEVAPVPKRAAPWMRVAQLILPPLLAAGAMGVHWGLNVPEKIVESPNDQGAKGKKPEKKKKTPRERRPRDTARNDDRTDEELDAEWERLRVTPFDEEPTRGRWARHHQVVINRAVVAARQQAFEGAPEEPNVVLASTTCRTVRCRFVLRSPSDRELDRIRAALERLRIGGDPAWRSFEVESIEATEELKPPAEPPRLLQFTVAFRSDDNEANALEIAPATAGNQEGGAPDDDDDDDEPDDADSADDAI